MPEPTQPPKHIQELFDAFVDHAFPPLHPAQRKELRLTFFAGAFSVVECINKAALMPDQDAMKVMLDIEKEVLDTCEEIATLGRTRN